MNTTNTANELINALWDVAAKFQQFADYHHVGVMWAEMINTRSAKNAWDVAHKINNIGASDCKDLSALKSVACALAFAGVDSGKDIEFHESALFHAENRLREMTERFKAFNLGARK